MPIIVRKCRECEHEQETIENRATADLELTECPKCEKEALERVISASSFILSGSGWFKTGY